MKKNGKLVFFNFFRGILKLLGVDRILPFFTAGKGYDNFFVKCIPQNYQYAKGTFRKVKRDEIWFDLDLSEYMEWVIYYDLNVEKRDALYPLVREDMVLFDVGSNIGETLLHFAKMAGPNGRVFGFEPVPETYRKCKRNTELNNFSNLSLNQLALSDKAEILYFEPSGNNNSGGVFLQKNQSAGREQVRAITLDEFTDQLGLKKIDIIKIDVEGFEPNVIEGAVSTIRKYKPLLFIEIDKDNLARQGVTIEQFFNRIVQLDYSIKKADGDDLSQNHYDIICTPN